jgi:hypothetical protein
MVHKKPAGYDDAREAAPDRPIEFSELEEFVFQEAPGIDTVDCKSLDALRMIWQGAAARVNPRQTAPELVKDVNEDVKVLYFCKFCEDRKLFDATQIGDRFIPIFTLQTDVYACYDACHDWWCYKVSALKHTSKLDNGWSRHGIRLLARFQEFKLLGTQSWWKDSAAFEPNKDAHTLWEARKRRRVG